MADTKIEWTRGADGSAGKVWNPLAGCSVVSPGCTNCYAMRLAGRPARMSVKTAVKYGGADCPDQGWSGMEWSSSTRQRRVTPAATLAQAGAHFRKFDV